MKNFTTTAFIIASSLAVNAQDVKTITDCTVTYDVSVQDPDAAKSLAGTTSILYIKGSKIRNDLQAPNYKQSTIYDAKTDSTVVLKESGKNKFIYYVDKNKKREQNKKYQGIQFFNTDEKKTILGYECRKVVAKLADGSTYNVYYTPSVLPANMEYEYQFRDLPGFVLEYEALSEDGKTKIKYSASKILLLPVPLAKFDVPKSGYRVLQ